MLCNVSDSSKCFTCLHASKSLTQFATRAVTVRPVNVYCTPRRHQVGLLLGWLFRIDALFSSTAGSQLVASREETQDGGRVSLCMGKLLTCLKYHTQTDLVLDMLYLLCCFAARPWQVKFRSTSWPTQDPMKSRWPSYPSGRSPL